MKQEAQYQVCKWRYSLYIEEKPFVNGNENNIPFSSPYLRCKDRSVQNSNLKKYN